jgi:hypothetical protein
VTRARAARLPSAGAPPPPRRSPRPRDGSRWTAGGPAGVPDPPETRPRARAARPAARRRRRRMQRCPPRRMCQSNRSPQRVGADPELGGEFGRSAAFESRMRPAGVVLGLPPDAFESNGEPLTHEVDVLDGGADVAVVAGLEKPSPRRLLDRGERVEAPTVETHVLHIDPDRLPGLADDPLAPWTRPSRRGRRGPRAPRRFAIAPPPVHAISSPPTR